MLINKGTIELKTSRLLLRRLTLDDAPEMYKNWATDEKTTKYLSWDSYTDIEKLKNFLIKCVKEYENPECYHWTIEYEGNIIGTINLHNFAKIQETLRNRIVDRVEMVE